MIEKACSTVITRQGQSLCLSSFVLPRRANKERVANARPGAKNIKTFIALLIKTII
jgi:hypothetical protein